MLEASTPSQRSSTGAQTAPPQGVPQNRTDRHTTVAVEEINSTEIESRFAKEGSGESDRKSRKPVGGKASAPTFIGRTETHLSTKSAPKTKPSKTGTLGISEAPVDGDADGHPSFTGNNAGSKT